MNVNKLEALLYNVVRLVTVENNEFIGWLVTIEGEYAILPLQMPLGNYSLPKYSADKIVSIQYLNNGIKIT